MIHRFFFDGSLQLPSIALEGTEFHHLIHVMRFKIGDTVEVVNGRGSLAKASVTALERSAAILHIHHTNEHSFEGPTLILAQAWIRSIEWVIEKGTELGATEFWLFPGQLGEKKQGKEERLRTVAISALKQCRTLFLPKIVLKSSLDTWEKPQGTLFFGDLSPNAPKLFKAPDPITIAIGPEKGFSEEEISRLKALGAQGVRLHDNILRAETAGITALSQLYLC
jgi:16S rRNA (uracil1498-N3)-methyltransferase